MKAKIVTFLVVSLSFLIGGCDLMEPPSPTEYNPSEGALDPDLVHHVVKSTPSGAFFWLDGDSLGASPIDTVTQSRGDTVELGYTLWKPGYKPVQGFVGGNRGIQNRSFRLEEQIEVNTKPTAIASVSRSFVSRTPTEIVIRDAGSSDADGNIQNRRIILPDGSLTELGGQTDRYTHTLDSDGLYKFLYQVQDDDGAWSDPLPLPVVVYTGNALDEKPITRTSFSGGNSFDERDLPVTVTVENNGSESRSDSPVETIEWTTSRGHDPVRSTTQSFTFEERGIVHIFGRAVTTDGQYGTTSVLTVNIAPVVVEDSVVIKERKIVKSVTYQPPVAKAKLLTDSPVTVGQTVEFADNGSYSPGGLDITREWNITGKDAQAGESGEVVFGTPGEKFILLRVTDEKGQTGTRILSVLVQEEQPDKVQIQLEKVYDTENGARIERPDVVEIRQGNTVLERRTNTQITQNSPLVFTLDEEAATAQIHVEDHDYNAGDASVSLQHSSRLIVGLVPESDDVDDTDTRNDFVQRRVECAIPQDQAVLAAGGPREQTIADCTVIKAGDEPRGLVKIGVKLDLSGHSQDEEDVRFDIRNESGDVVASSDVISDDGTHGVVTLEAVLSGEASSKIQPGKEYVIVAVAAGDNTSANSVHFVPGEDSLYFVYSHKVRE